MPEPRAPATAAVKSGSKNARIIYDPELASAGDRKEERKRKPVYRINGQSETPVVVRDPRRGLGHHYPKPNSGRYKRNLRPHLRLLTYQYDDNSIGGPPAREIVISNISPIATPDQIMSQFRALGDIQNVDLKVDPRTGASLGLCRIEFRAKQPANIGSGHAAAKRAVRERNGIKLGSSSWRVELDADGVKCDTLVAAALERREGEERAREAQAAASAAAARRRQQDLEEEQLRMRRQKLEEESLREKPKQPETIPRRSRFDQKSKPDGVKASPQESGGPQGLLQDKTYLFLPATSVSPGKYNRADIKAYFERYRWTRVANDETGFYIVFDHRESAQKCYAEMNGSIFEGCRVQLILHDKKAGTSRGELAGGNTQMSSKFKRAFKPVDPIHEAMVTITRDLTDAFMKDLRNKVAGPALFEFANPALYGQYTQAKEANGNKSAGATMYTPATVAVAQLLQSGTNGLAAVSELAETAGKMTLERGETHEAGRALPLLPRIKKVGDRNGAGTSAGRQVRRADVRPMLYSLAQDTDDQSDSSRMSDEESAYSETADEDPVQRGSANSLNGLKKQRVTEHSKASQRVIHFTSSEDESEDGDHLSDEPKSIDFNDSGLSEMNSPMNEEKPHLDNKSKIPRGTGPPKGRKTMAVVATPPVQLLKKKDAKKISVSKKQEQSAAIKREDHETSIEIEDQVKEEPGEASNELRSKSDEPSFDSRYLTTELCFEDPADNIVLDLDGVQELVQRDEDVRYLQEALKALRVTPPQVDAEEYAYLLKDTKSRSSEALVGVQHRDKLSDGVKDGPRVNLTGSARTEGYYPISDSDKSQYLPQRNRATVMHEAADGRASSAANGNPAVASLSSASGRASSRMNRVNNRRLQAGVENSRSMLSTETDLLRFNALKTRKKQLRFGASRIHTLGLFAREPIEANEMVMEYVGEIIRQPVADLREKQYERMGIGSSYLFRIDEETIIDATKTGNECRLINHSCDPNCKPKIIKVQGEKKIVIYAQRDIATDEELSFDYKFPREDDPALKIPCLCGSPLCRGTLN